MIELSDKEKNTPLPDIVMDAKGLTKVFGKFIANDNVDIELKKGEINEKCDNVLTQFFQTDCPRNLYYNIREFGKGELDQLMRMARQQLRSAHVLTAINIGEGVDIATDMLIKIPTKNSL